MMLKPPKMLKKKELVEYTPLSLYILMTNGQCRVNERKDDLSINIGIRPCQEEKHELYSVQKDETHPC